MRLCAMGLQTIQIRTDWPPNAHWGIATVENSNANVTYFRNVAPRVRG